MSRRIKVGVIGAGRIGAHHARILGRHPEVELVGVCDVNSWRAQLAAWRAGASAFSDYRDLLSKVEAAVIAVPTERHHEVGSAALSLGVHSLIEKPLAANLEQARALLELSEQKKAVLQVGHVERFNPAVLKGIEYIRSPRYITVERLGPYDPRVSGIGVVLDLMIHDLDIALTLVGAEVESLEAIGARLLSPHEDIANVRVRFKTGCVVDLTASRISIKKSRKIRIFQDTGYISLDYQNAELRVYRKKEGVDAIKSLKDVDMLAPRLDKTEPLKSEINHFLDCIRHDRKPWPSGEHGLAALKLALQVTEELQKYERSQSSRSAAFAPSWADRLAEVAREVSKSSAGPA